MPTVAFPLAAKGISRWEVLGILFCIASAIAIVGVLLTSPGH
jgi:hypothetical protein